MVSTLEKAPVKLVTIFNQVPVRAHAPYINRGTMHNNILTEHDIYNTTVVIGALGGVTIELDSWIEKL